MYKVKLLVSYDGTQFVGWQKQKGDLVSIQGIMETAVSKIFNTPTQVVASGRTDSGVHAIGQVCHFQCEKDPRSFPLVLALQKMTPNGITVKKAWIAPREFHARASAYEKTYRYYILNREEPSAFFDRYSWHLRKPLSIDWLNEATGYLIGQHDFKSFQSTGTPVKTTVREIYEAKWTHGKHGLLIFTVRGSGFLKQMVRNIVGTLVDSERQKREPSVIDVILNSKDRKAAGRAAPARGLFLVKVKYPKNLIAQCQVIPS